MFPGFFVFVHHPWCRQQHSRRPSSCLRSYSSHFVSRRTRCFSRRRSPRACSRRPFLYYFCNSLRCRHSHSCSHSHPSRHPHRSRYVPLARHHRSCHSLLDHFMTLFRLLTSSVCPPHLPPLPAHSYINLSRTYRPGRSTSSSYYNISHFELLATMYGCRNTLCTYLSASYFFIVPYPSRCPYTNKLRDLSSYFKCRGLIQTYLHDMSISH